MTLNLDLNLAPAILQAQRFPKRSDPASFLQARLGRSRVSRSSTSTFTSTCASPTSASHSIALRSRGRIPANDSKKRQLEPDLG
jgi:hypothetical protein